MKIRKLAIILLELSPKINFVVWSNSVSGYFGYLAAALSSYLRKTAPWLLCQFTRAFPAFRQRVGGSPKMEEVTFKPKLITVMNCAERNL